MAGLETRERGDGEGEEGGVGGATHSRGTKRLKGIDGKRKRFASMDMTGWLFSLQRIGASLLSSKTVGLHISTH